MKVKQKALALIQASIGPEDIRSIESVTVKRSRKTLAKQTAKSLAWSVGLSALTAPFGFFVRSSPTPQPAYLVVTDTRIAVFEKPPHPKRDNLLFVVPIRDVSINFSGTAFKRITLLDPTTADKLAALSFGFIHRAFERSRTVIESSPHYRRLPPPPQSPAAQPNGAAWGQSDQYQYPPQPQYPYQPPQYQYQYEEPPGWERSQPPEYGYQLPPEWGPDGYSQPSY